MEEISRNCASDNLQDTPVPSFYGKQRLTRIPFSCIRTFAQHPFRLYEGERLADMVESIRQNGILMPLIVRTIDESDYEYEMLSGHNRMNAAVLAGLADGWCLVKEDLSDKDALMYVIETNLQQRSFTDLLPSEKAVVLTMRYSEMFSQGKRNDIIRELQLLENPDAEALDTCGTEFHKTKSRDALGREYGLTGRAVAGYLRIDKLSESLKLRLDTDGMTIKAGITLSYLSDENQISVETALLERSGKLTDMQAGILRKAGEEAALTPQTVLELLSEKPKTSAPSLRLRQETYAPYFKENTPTKEIERIVGEALKLYFSQQSADQSA